MDERMDEHKSPCVLQDIAMSPSGPLPCFLPLQFTIMQSRALGIADRILPLGDLLSPQLLPKCSLALLLPTGTQLG